MASRGRGASTTLRRSRRAGHRADTFRRARNNQYTFSGQFSGGGFADFLLGGMSSSSVLRRIGGYRRGMLAFYVLDDWKVSPKLTLNIGLRYRIQPGAARVGRIDAYVQSHARQRRRRTRFPKQNTSAEAFYKNIRPDLPFGYLDRETLFNPDKNNFAPRFGFAYRPFGGNRTVIRGGYGWYYSSAQLMNLVQNSVTGPPAQFWAGYTSDVRTPTHLRGRCHQPEWQPHQRHLRRPHRTGKSVAGGLHTAVELRRGAGVGQERGAGSAIPRIQRHAPGELGSTTTPLSLRREPAKPCRSPNGAASSVLPTAAPRTTTPCCFRRRSAWVAACNSKGHTPSARL